MILDGPDYCYMEGHVYPEGKATCSRCGDTNKAYWRFLMWESARAYFKPLTAIYGWIRKAVANGKS